MSTYLQYQNTRILLGDSCKDRGNPDAGTAPCSPEVYHYQLVIPSENSNNNNTKCRAPRLILSENSNNNTKFRVPPPYGRKGLKLPAHRGSETY